MGEKITSPPPVPCPSDALDSKDHTARTHIKNTLIWIRSLVFLLYLIVTSLVFGVIASPALLLGVNIRRKFCQFWCRMVLFGLRLICNISAQITGRDHIPAGGIVIAANHQSMWETLQLYIILHKPVMVLKQELLAIPLFGSWLKASGCIALDRSAGPKAMRQLIRDAITTTADGGQVIIFPEGTRTRPGHRRDLKPGIAGIYGAAKVPCLPVGHNSGCHWRHPGSRKIPGTITMTIAPVIPVGHDRKTFMTTLTSTLQALRPDLTAT